MDLVSLLVGIFLIIVIASIAYAVIKVGFKVVKSLVINTVLGLIILGVVNLVGIKVPINWITVLLSAIAGIPGAIIAIILFLIGVI
jgi:hypothetical protein